MTANKKSQAREFCFQYFFHMQLPIFKELREENASSSDDKAILNSIADFKESTGTFLEGELFKFVVDQTKSALENYNDLEEKISGYLKNWKLNRLAKVDHTVLLLAFNEMLYYKQTPPKVAINEYIDIAKKFGSKESGSFVNGILDNFAKKEIL